MPCFPPFMPQLPAPSANRLVAGCTPLWGECLFEGVDRQHDVGWRVVGQSLCVERRACGFLRVHFRVIGRHVLLSYISLRTPLHLMLPCGRPQHERLCMLLGLPCSDLLWAEGPGCMRVPAWMASHAV